MPLVLLDKCVNLFAGWLTENWELSFEEQKNLFALVFFRVVARVSAALRPTRYLTASKHRSMEGPFTQKGVPLAVGMVRLLQRWLQSVNMDPGQPGRGGKGHGWITPGHQSRPTAQQLEIIWILNINTSPVFNHRLLKVPISHLQFI